MHGDEPGLRRALESFFDQDYPAPVQIVFGVRDAADPAAQIAREIARRRPQADVVVVADARVWGANLKVSNLINMQAAIRHPLIVLADSDVSVGPGYLRRLAGALGDPTVGYATCAFVGVPTGNGWSRLAAMAINHHFLPSIALALRLGLAQPCFGPTIAFRRSVLEAAGGFTRFRDHLADDFEIGRAIRALGYGFAVPAMLVGHACPERSAACLLRHEVRWARTIRLIDSAGYAASVVCHPMAFALAACGLMQGAPAAWACLSAVAASRLMVIAIVTRLTGADAAAWWLAPARDLLSGGVHGWGFLARTVHWRGRRFTVRADGALAPLAQRVRPARVLARRPWRPRLDAAPKRSLSA